MIESEEKQRKLIVNADDFGLNCQVNCAIVEAFQKNYINNTTIMANMPAFDEAVDLAKKNGFFGRVGLHINLFEGVPLSEKIKGEPLFYDMAQGVMQSQIFLHKSPRWKWFFLPRHTRDAIKEEVEAQIQRYLEAGFPQMHCDSHGHSHTFASVFFSMRSSLKKYGFKTIRKSLNLANYKMNPYKKIYKKLYNMWLSVGFQSTDFFLTLTVFWHVRISRWEKAMKSCCIRYTMKMED